MARQKIKGRAMNERFTGYGEIQPGAKAGKPIGDQILDDFVSDVKGRIGFKHTPDVEASFKRRGRAAYNRGKGY